MTTETTSNRRYVFPFLTAFLLLGTFAVLLTVMINQASLVHQVQDSFPQPTTIPPTEVAAAVIEETAQPEAPAEATEAAVVEVAQAEPVSFDPAVVAAGQTNFTICTACHGLNAQGVPGLGKDLVHSEFVHSLTDEELHQFIVEGRGLSDPLNTTGMVMPARGGNPAMTDEQIDTIVVYLRSLAADAGVGAAQPSGEANTAPETVAAAPAPTRDPSIVAAPWTAPVPVSGAYVAVEDLPADAQALYRWAESNAEPPITIDLIDPSLLLPENQAALIEYLTNETGYLDSRGLYPRPTDGRAMGE
jgi:disulfide bond formation protein DsbB